LARIYSISSQIREIVKAQYLSDIGPDNYTVVIKGTSWIVQMREKSKEGWKYLDRCISAVCGPICTEFDLALLRIDIGNTRVAVANISLC